MRARTLMLTAILAAVNAGCSDSPTGPGYRPEIPLRWVSSVSNAYFPLVPGTTHRFSGQTPDGVEMIVYEVLSETRVVQGVTATVVRDRVYLDGALIEDTYDWFAQDSAGNVWYLGEDSKEIENGQVLNTDGSWEWGVDGALPGIVMWADPAAHVGINYRQEYYEDEAEDFAKILAVNETVVVPFGTFTGCIKTEDWNALDPAAHEYKYYCPQLGMVLETMAPSGAERIELVGRTP